MRVAVGNGVRCWCATPAVSIKNWMGPYPRTPTLPELLDTQIYIGVFSGSWDFWYSRIQEEVLYIVKPVTAFGRTHRFGCYLKSPSPKKKHSTQSLGHPGIQWWWIFNVENPHPFALWFDCNHSFPTRVSPCFLFENSARSSFNRQQAWSQNSGPVFWFG